MYDCGIVCLVVVHRHFKFLCAFNHVVVGHDISVGADDHTGGQA